ncbi:MAG: strawberry notch family protein, partial [Deltaproteobacteria bacterium]|nr:strawberry notch family protein [Deltaproteobacteria bacterium]
PTSDALFTTAGTLLPVLEAGRPLDAATLRDAMTRAFGATDAHGAWVWKDAYEAAESAVVLFIRRHGRAMRRHAGAGPDGPGAMLKMLEAVAALEPSHTKRSEEQIRLQQFSTPLPLAYAVLRAAAIRPGDMVLEPSAGTGMLAVMAACALGSAAGNLHLNEIADARRALLCRLFPETLVTGVNAENIADRLPGARPTVVIMNPPFSATPGVGRIRHGTDLRHVRSAFCMPPPGGRLVAITSANCIPGNSDWNSAFGRLDPPARVVFSMAIDGRAYARRGTGFDTRLTVLDRTNRPGIDVDPGARAATVAALLDAVISRVPPRLPVEVRTTVAVPGRDLFGNTATLRPSKPPTTPAPASTASTPAHDWGPVSELAVETGAANSAADVGNTTSGPYEPWRPAAFHIPAATTHPTPLVQSAAMAAVPHPTPSYRPMLPERVVTGDLLSDAQLESVVLAGQAHEGHLAASYRIGSGWETVQRCGDDDQGDITLTDDGETLSAPVRFRRGWMLGDGTGCGKGRQVAAIILDGWLRGRK